MSQARRATAPVAVGGTPQVGVSGVERLDVDEQHGDAPRLECGGRLPRRGARLCLQGWCMTVGHAGTG